MASLPQRVVLLFCHGGSFNKESWAPIIRRVRAAPLLQRVPSEIVAFDWRYHGARSDDSDPGTLLYEGEDGMSPRVEHPARHWTKWAPQDLVAMVTELRRDDAKLARSTRIVGIGHSMGASSLLRAEVSTPGTFDGLVLFEPPCNDVASGEGGRLAADMMVSYTVKRVQEWDTWEEVVKHFKTGKPYRRWDPESLAAFLKGGIKRTDDGKRYRLAMSLLQEASLYCHEIMRFSMDEFARVKCKVALEYGGETQLFNREIVYEIPKALPKQYFFINGPLEGTTHLTVIEDPEACARHILADLELFPPFETHAKNSSRL